MNRIKLLLIFTISFSCIAQDGIRQKARDSFFNELEKVFSKENFWKIKREGFLLKIEAVDTVKLQNKDVNWGFWLYFNEELNISKFYEITSLNTILIEIFKARLSQNSIIFNGDISDLVVYPCDRDTVLKSIVKNSKFAPNFYLKGFSLYFTETVPESQLMFCSSVFLEHRIKLIREVNNIASKYLSTKGDKINIHPKFYPNLLNHIYSSENEW